MTNIKVDTAIREELSGFNTDDLSGEEAHIIAQELVKEFISTKQRMLTDDRKLNVIGKALIDQKEALEEILRVQGNHGEELTESLENVVKKQEGVSDKISSITQSMDELQAARGEQEKFIEDLELFKERHNELSQISKDQSDKSVDRLRTVYKKVSDLYEHIDGVDIEDRVEDISKRTIDIDELLKDHAGKQELAREDASRNMLDLLAEVTLFRRQLSEEGLLGRLSDIQSESESSKMKINSLNEKFDNFIEIYELSKVKTKDTSDLELEDIFSDVAENLYEDDKDDKDEISDLEEGVAEEDMDRIAHKNESHTDEGSKPNDRSSGEGSKNLSTFEATEIPEYGRTRIDSKELDNNERKQGFFKKLFGGR